MSSSPIPRFDPTAALPTGRVAIEASAGTGKTYALSSLATRYVVEGDLDIGDLLVVTFTRAAAAELRDRVRDRLAQTRTALATVLDGGDPPADDEVLRLLCAGDLEERLERSTAALAGFDSACITTIHGFASQMLGALGVASGDFDATFAEDGDETLRQTCADLLVAAALSGAHPADHLPDHDTLLKLARAVGGNPGIALAPDPDPASSNDIAVLRRRLVERVVLEAERRRRAQATLSFDDLLTRLRDALASTGGGMAVRDALRRRFKVALIDEFQDTDPVQWQIFDAVFGRPDTGSTLVIVGDPKQSIYAFRGADVHTYLEAIDSGTTRSETLATNWRSDATLLDALDALLSGATFGDERIRFHQVEPAPGHGDQRIRSVRGEELPALSLRLATHPSLGRQQRSPGVVLADHAEQAVYADLAEQVRLLLEDAELRDGDLWRRVTPRDVAVLVVANKDAADVQSALAASDIPAVVSRGVSVLETTAAQQWRWLLEAVGQPADPRRAGTAALSWFVGWTADRLHHDDGTALAEVQEQLHHWASVLRTRGPAEFLRRVRSDSGVAPRLLARPSGERDLTDLDHLAELLTLSAPAHAGPAGLVAALDRLADLKPDETGLSITARRIESEADAVQIMTVHAAKGLEFPIVCCPNLWRGSPTTVRDLIIYADPQTGRRTIDLCPEPPWPDNRTAKERKRLAERAAVGENLRLLYVALTRARHRLLVWWCRASLSDRTGLARVLFARDGQGRIDPQLFDAERVAIPPDNEVPDRLRPIVTAAGGTVATAIVGPPAGPVRWEGGTGRETGELSVATLERELDRARRRWSFTMMARAYGESGVDPFDDTLGDAAAGDEPPEDLTGEPMPAEDLTPDTPAAKPALPLGDVRGGTAFGNLVHDVLEHTDFAACDLRAELHQQVVRAARWRRTSGVDPDTLTEGLICSLTTPLGPQLDHRCLRDFERADRLDELAFELALAGRGTGADDASIGGLILRHLPAGHGLRPWAETLADGALRRQLAGHLTGSIDLVLRLKRHAQPDRFVVVDYKTNALTPRGASPALEHYHPDRLPAAMAEHHYPLQALLYAVALHRYLRWRVPGYDPAIHLGGITYLFLRGMVGPETPTAGGVPYGVFAWQPPAALITELSDLLHGREVTP
ncbi:UvrD-helicase domain-containing protein [Rhabdothermincola sediminis]|uniref:UvrD-helicase domain-containing protein n=1 Tax=Rhabdothermincola sediminis TaxID=2751370 RepID=UPI001AA0169A|nr:UvrD-helicase domain-containing protein [Rhabdothermincola sediminis]